MKLFAALAALLFAAVPAQAQTAPREVNITADSAPGWVPSIAQDQAVDGATDAWFAALESGDFARAYAMLAPANRTEPYADFARRNAAARDNAGALRGRTVLKVTWTKDPANAPAPGVYAAVDIAERHANVDRQCGYLIWYQPPEGGPFLLMRTETSRFDNAAAAQIEKQQGRAEVDRVWAVASANCPNYRMPD